VRELQIAPANALTHSLHIKSAADDTEFGARQRELFELVRLGILTKANKCRAKQSWSTCNSWPEEFVFVHHPYQHPPTVDITQFVFALAA
jgi:hypothetical protein